MDTWKIQLAVIFYALVQTYQALSSTVVEESGFPLDWQESLESGLMNPMVNLMKRSKALRFYGLMGKRSGTKKPFQVNRRGNKGEMFVGLMGRSISNGDHLTRMISPATSEIHVSDGPHKQDSSEEWAQILY